MSGSEFSNMGGFSQFVHHIRFIFKSRLVYLLIKLRMSPLRHVNFYKQHGVCSVYHGEWVFFSIKMKGGVVGPQYFMEQLCQ